MRIMYHKLQYMYHSIQAMCSQIRTCSGEISSRPRTSVPWLETLQDYYHALYHYGNGFITLTCCCSSRGSRMVIGHFEMLYSNSITDSTGNCFCDELTSRKRSRSKFIIVSYLHQLLQVSIKLKYVFIKIHFLKIYLTINI